MNDSNLQNIKLTSLNKSLDSKDNRIKLYINALKDAIDDEDNFNIAITGSYGSGKTTIIKQFIKKYIPNDNTTSKDTSYQDKWLSIFKYFRKKDIPSNNITSKDNKYQDKCLSISLANFSSNNVEDKQLEISILQHIFYSVGADKLPLSRFKRIDNSKNRDLTVIKIILITLRGFAVLYSLLMLFKFDFIENINPNNWLWSFEKFNITQFIGTLGALIILLVIVCYSWPKIYGLCKTLTIKFNSKNGLEVESQFDKVNKDQALSVFNLYLEEILYFFEQTNFNIVIIEDIDRFDDINIFSKFRELNTILNNYEPIKQKHRIRFIYAVKDDLFEENNKIEDPQNNAIVSNYHYRVKFFDCIIPIIPYVNYLNASDKLFDLLCSEELSKEFIANVTLLMYDIDMRFLRNLVNEYNTYKTVLISAEHQQKSLEKLFSMIVYKNRYIEDYWNLHQQSGAVYYIFSQKNKLRTELKKNIDTKISEIDAKIINLTNNESLKNINELKAVYLYRLVAEINKFLEDKQNNQKFVGFIDSNNNEISMESAFSDEHFSYIKTSSPISCKVKSYYAEYPYYQQVKVKSHPENIKTEVTFAQIEKEIDDQTYEERESRLKSDRNERLEILKQEKNDLVESCEIINAMSFNELLNTFLQDKKILDFITLIPEDKNKITIEKFLNDELIVYLLKNGYIDDSYQDCMSLFHGDRDNYEFLINLINDNKSEMFDKELKDIQILFRKDQISKEHFQRESIMNYSLLDFLILNESKDQTNIDNFFKLLGKKNDAQFNFIQGFLNHSPKHLPIFIKKVCNVRNSIWLNIRELPKEQAIKFLEHIFNYADLESIINFEEQDTLVDFLQKIDIFSFF